MPIELPGATACATCRSRPDLCDLSAATISSSMSRSLSVPLDLVGPRPHALRPAPARRRRNPAAVDTAGISVAVAALSRGADLRLLDRHRRRLSLDRAECRLQPRHDGGPGLHRAGRADLRQMAAVAGASAPACSSACSMPSRSACRACASPVIGEVPVQLIQALALCSDRVAAGRLHRQCRRAQGDRRALCERALRCADEDMIARWRAS